jgi:hypothetical protein
MSIRTIIRRDKNLTGKVIFAFSSFIDANFSSGKPEHADGDIYEMLASRYLILTKKP